MASSKDRRAFRKGVAKFQRIEEVLVYKRQAGTIEVLQCLLKWPNWRPYRYERDHEYWWLNQRQVMDGYVAYLIDMAYPWEDRQQQQLLPQDIMSERWKFSLCWFSSWDMTRGLHWRAVGVKPYYTPFCSKKIVKSSFFFIFLHFSDNINPPDREEGKYVSENIFYVIVFLYFVNV